MVNIAFSWPASCLECSGLSLLGCCSMHSIGMQKPQGVPAAPPASAPAACPWLAALLALGVMGTHSLASCRPVCLPAYVLACPPHPPCLPACLPFCLPASSFAHVLQEVMRDPVIASDGFSYERSAIQGEGKAEHMVVMVWRSFCDESACCLPAASQPPIKPTPFACPPLRAGTYHQVGPAHIPATTCL